MFRLWYMTFFGDRSRTHRMHIAARGARWSMAACRIHGMSSAGRARRLSLGGWIGIPSLGGAITSRTSSTRRSTSHQRRLPSPGRPPPIATEVWFSVISGGHAVDRLVLRRSALSPQARHWPIGWSSALARRLFAAGQQVLGRRDLYGLLIVKPLLSSPATCCGASSIAASSTAAAAWLPAACARSGSSGPTRCSPATSAPTPDGSPSAQRPLLAHYLFRLFHAPLHGRKLTISAERFDIDAYDLLCRLPAPSSWRLLPRQGRIIQWFALLVTLLTFVLTLHLPAHYRLRPPRLPV